MIIISARFENRSTRTPPSSPNSSIGANCIATVMPTCATDPVSCSTSQSWAMRCIQPAVIATRFVAVNSRKFGTDRAMSVWRHGGRGGLDRERFGGRGEGRR